MIKFQATAKVHSVSPVLEIASKSGNPFRKRELILDDSFTRDGQTYQSFVLVEFTGDRMSMLDGFFPGQLVNVEGVINGRPYNDKVFNTVKGMKITPYQSQQTAVPQGYAPQSVYPAQQAPPQYPQNHGAPQYPQQGGYTPSQPYVPGNPIGNPYPPKY